MTEDLINAYEGLFLFPQAQMGDLQTAQDHLTDILDRAEAQLISLRKWDERRLAYEIKGNKRGVYFLVYFKCRGSAIAVIERSANLSELLLRFMITCADHLTQEQMEAADGTVELADEIKLRSEEPATAAGGREAAGGATEPEKPVAAGGKEPLTVETQATRDAATT